MESAFNDRGVELVVDHAVADLAELEVRAVEGDRAALEPGMLERGIDQRQVLVDLVRQREREQELIGCF